MKYICVFCSANELPEKYVTPAKEFARLMVEQGFNLVYGGSDMGLMSVVASEVQQAGGSIIGITFAVYEHELRENVDEKIIASSLGERKALMLARSDAIAVLPGGIGTLDEVAEMLELKKHKAHNKPIVFINVDNFYTGLKTQFQKMETEGFLPSKFSDIAYFAGQPQEALDYIKTALAQK